MVLHQIISPGNNKRFVRHMGGYIERLGEITCLFVELQNLGRRFLSIFAFLADMKSLG